jgi:hypothetical protein
MNFRAFIGVLLLADSLLEALPEDDSVEAEVEAAAVAVTASSKVKPSMLKPQPRRRRPQAAHTRAAPTGAVTGQSAHLPGGAGSAKAQLLTRGPLDLSFVDNVYEAAMAASPTPTLRMFLAMYIR